MSWLSTYMSLESTPKPSQSMSQNHICEICEMDAKYLRSAAKWCEVDGVKAAKRCETPAKWPRNGAKWCETTVTGVCT